jgi:flagellar basal-body rod protein FlgB
MVNNTNMLDFLEAGMRLGDTRQKAIANNVANMNTPGYRRYDVDFQDVLTKAIDSGRKPDEADMEAALFQPKNTPVNMSGNDVSMETEVGEMVKNSLMHQAYTLLLKKKYEQMRAAIQI